MRGSCRASNTRWMHASPLSFLTFRRRQRKIRCLKVEFDFPFSVNCLDRYTEIERENRILLEKMTHIMHQQQNHQLGSLAYKITVDQPLGSPVPDFPEQSLSMIQPILTNSAVKTRKNLFTAQTSHQDFVPSQQETAAMKSALTPVNNNNNMT